MGGRITLSRLAGVAAAGASLAMAVGAGAHYVRYSRGHEDALALLRSTGLARRSVPVTTAVEKDADPVRARLTVARALLAESFNPAAFHSLPLREAVEEASRMGERLALAETAARETLAVRPAAWEAAMILGGGRYLAWSGMSDGRVVTRRREWEQPLLAACGLAPAEAEPVRLLALAWLEVWPRLSAAEKARARPILRRAFEDPGSFALLVGPWFAAAGSFAAASALVPESAPQWGQMEAILARSGRWEESCEAASHARRLEMRELGATLDAASSRLAGGDLEGARRAALGVLASAPFDAEGEELAIRALHLVPAGSSAGAGGAVCAWVRWSCRAFVAGRKGPTGADVARLLDGCDRLAPAEEALARLVAGDIARAETIERRGEALNTEPWAPFYLAKARRMAERGDAEAARDALAAVHRLWRDKPVAVATRAAVADMVGDAALGREARRQLAALAAEAWPNTAWEWSGGRAFLSFVAGRAAGGLTVQPDVAPASGAVVALTFDDAPLALAVVRPGVPVDAPAAVSPGLHELELTTHAGGQVIPGRVVLR